LFGCGLGKMSLRSKIYLLLIARALILTLCAASPHALSCCDGAMVLRRRGVSGRAPPLLMLAMLPGGTPSTTLPAPVAPAITGVVPSTTLRVNGLFSDSMVLQTNYEGGLRPFLHGSAAPGEVVTLMGAPSRTKGKNSFTAIADGTTGRWVMQLDPHIQVDHRGFTLVLSGSSNPSATIVARDVVYGDVFLCSGQVWPVFDCRCTGRSLCPPIVPFDGCVLRMQSNMELKLTYDSNATAEIAEADTLPNFRLFTVPFNPQPRPVEGPLPGTWKINSAQAASEFSAVCYLSALHFWRMRRDLNSTHFVGLVWAAVGGTCIESWMDGAALRGCGLPGENQPSPAGRAVRPSFPSFAVHFD
jgi:hypothetical protein